MAKINVKETEVAIINSNEKDYISITDIANIKQMIQVQLLVIGCVIEIPLLGNYTQSKF